MKEQPLVVAISAVLNDGKILLIKRKNPPYENLYCLPGGKVRFGENIEAAAVRELKEEVGIDAEVVALRGILDEILSDGCATDGSAPDGHFLLFVFEARPRHTAIKSSDEADVFWVDLDKIEKLRAEFVPSDFRMIKEFVLAKKKVSLYAATMKKTADGYALEKFGAVVK